MNRRNYDDPTYRAIARVVPDLDQLTNEVIEQISNFNWLWPCFESTQCGGSANGSMLDAFSIKREALNLLNNSEYRCSIDYFRDRYRDNDRLDHLAPIKYARNDRPVMEIGLSNGAEKTELSKALCRIVYRLRNNLFHGTKGSNGLANQHKNSIHANTLLRFWIMV